MLFNATLTRRPPRTSSMGTEKSCRGNFRGHQSTRLASHLPVRGGQSAITSGSSFFGGCCRSNSAASCTRIRPRHLRRSTACPVRHPRLRAHEQSHPHPHGPVPAQSPPRSSRRHDVGIQRHVAGSNIRSSQRSANFREVAEPASHQTFSADRPHHPRL